MTSPFDPNYKPQVDVTEIRKDAKVSRAATLKRARRLKSEDPEVVRSATGCLGDLSNRGLSPEYVKGRQKGGR